MRSARDAFRLTSTLRRDRLSDMNRRRFLRQAALASATLAPWHVTGAQEPSTPAAPRRDDRRAWVSRLTEVARPVLANLAANELKATMPVETAKGVEAGRRKVTHLEALGRT